MWSRLEGIKINISIIVCRLSLDALERFDQVPEAEFKSLPAQLRVTVRRRLLSTLVYDLEDSDDFYDMDDLHGFGHPYGDDIDDFYESDDYDYDFDDDMYGIFDNDDYEDFGASD
ncbi:hypothetical protein LSTR_LSTR006916 [Laodelphax striatellus]|uniref:Uncharacterized protein n=1 Tax=Laodelphax striatellus TaxID=195883 RepID=A0A482X3D2_LAOST|nr:hypothetical protein LSTR_LSTR006916 [Laodelphax striatellus]